MEIGGNQGRVRQRQGVLVDSHQIAGDVLIQIVNVLFTPADLRQQLLAVVQKASHGLVQVFHRHAGHPVDLLHGHIGGHGGIGQVLLVDKLQLVLGAVLLLVLTGHQQVGQLDDQVHEGIEHRHLEHLEQQVRHGDIAAQRILSPAGHGADDVRNLPGEERQHHKHQNGAEHIEQKVDQGSPLGILAAAHTGQHGGGASANVAAQDHEHAAFQRHQSAVTHHHQNGHRDRGGLHHRGDDQAHQQPQEGIGKGLQGIDDRGILPQLSHRRGHGGNAHKQDAEAHDHLAQLSEEGLLDVIHHHRAREHEDGGYRRQLEGHQQGRDGGADIGAEDNAAGLAQLHQARIHKADDHHGGSRGGLDHSGEEEPHHKAQESGSGKGGKHRPKPVARHLLNAAAHHIHTGNKQAQSANQGYHSQQHGITSALLHRM